MKPPSAQNFIRKAEPSAPATASGFEGSTAAEAPQAIEPVHKHRAMDLFLRGAITEDQMKEAAASLSGFERIIGKVDYLPAFFLEQGAAMSRATCLLQTSGVDYTGEPGSWSGTCFLITPNILVTNNHVLNSKEVARAAKCIFNYQITQRRTEAPTKTFRLDPERLFITSPAAGGLDYTFVWIVGNPGEEFGFVPIDRSAFTIAPNEYANIVGHPNGKMKVISIKENEVKWQDEMVVHYTSDTEPGASGSGVSNNNWQLVALHHASKPSQVPGFEFLNEGIKFSAIALDLERRARARNGDSRMAAEVLSHFGGTDENIGFFGLAGRPQATGENALERVVNSYVGTDQDLDIGIWNVEWLSNRYEEKAGITAQVIKDLKLDVWCLVETSPNGTAAVVEALRNDHGLDFAWEAAVPDSSDGKQSCTVMWNTRTVTGTKISWGEPIETWLTAHSNDFDSLGLEAVHGKIFDRYPALFELETLADVTPGKKLKFHLVPLHLKAMAEGSLRRQMASKILAAAIKRRNEDGHHSDYIIGGDFNAELASGDFNALSDAGLVAVSADDEADGAFTYVKRPHLSLIDHIFLSPNLAASHGADDFFIVAKEATFPNYIREVSDHRPVLLRLSMNGGTNQPLPENRSLEVSGDPARKAAMEELRKQLPPLVPAGQLPQRLAYYSQVNAGTGANSQAAGLVR